MSDLPDHVSLDPDRREEQPANNFCRTLKPRKPGVVSPPNLAS